MSLHALCTYRENSLNDSTPFRMNAIPPLARLRSPRLRVPPLTAAVVRRSTAMVLPHDTWAVLRPQVRPRIQPSPSPTPRARGDILREWQVNLTIFHAEIISKNIPNATIRSPEMSFTVLCSRSCQFFNEKLPIPLLDAIRRITTKGTTKARLYIKR